MSIIWSANIGVYFELNNVLLQKNDIYADFLE